MERKQRSNKSKKKTITTTREEDDIPQIQLIPTYYKVLRFKNLNTDPSADVTLLIGDLLSALGTVSASSTTGYPFAKSVKVKRISIWGAPKSDSSGAFSEAFIDWHSSSGFSSGNKKSDISISNARPCFVTSTPPRGSLCEFWCELTTVQYVTIRVPLGGIVDVHVDWKQAEAAVSPITSIFSAGFVYYGKLDFSTNALLEPVGLESFG
jgi:hypothetical protein